MRVVDGIFRRKFIGQAIQTVRNRNLTGNITALMTAHPICQKPDTLVLREEHGVFVHLSYAAYIRCTTGIDSNDRCGDVRSVFVIHRASRDAMLEKSQSVLTIANGQVVDTNDLAALISLCQI